MNPGGPPDGIPRQDVLGVQLACLDRTALVDLAAARCGEARAARPYSLTYANAHTLNLAQKDAAYRAALQAFDLVYADGSGPVFASRILYPRAGCRLEKLTGADWLDDLCSRLAARQVRVYILAGKPGIAARAGAILEGRYPGLQIAGTADGFFRTRTEEEVLRDIRERRPDLLFVGRGVPRQEQWIAAHIDQLGVKICWAVGALFDYPAGAERRAPQWMLALQLEWLWRLMVDPVGKWRRYLLGTPIFVGRVLATGLGRRRIEK